MVPRVSIIICTRDRADSLRKTLASIAQCQLPAELGAELLVVDNGSHDHTREVVKNAESLQISVRYVSEPTAGQCRARNRGLQEARGDIILFTDDDVLPPADWIVQMCGPIIRGEADAVAGGIEIAPDLERPWFGQGKFRSWLASTDQLDPNVGVRMVGANMAFSRRVFEKVDHFDVALGPGALGFEDDSLFSRQLLQAGYRLVPRLDVRVEHHFDSSRLARPSMLQMARRAGLSQGYVAHHWEHQKPSWPVLRALKVRLRFLAWRLFHLRTWWLNSEVTWTEWDTLKWIAFWKGYREVMHQPRKYERFGLRRVGAAD